MSVRLICAAGLRHIRSKHLHFTVIHNKFHAKLLQLPCPIASYTPAVQRLQFLHQTVYDKNAGFDQKRQVLQKEATKEANLEDKPAVRGRRNQEDLASTKYVSEEESIKKYDREEENNPDFGSNADVFGNADLNETIDRGDLMEEEYTKNPTRRTKKLRTKEYAKMIKELINEKRLKAAINVLEVRMLKEDRVKPENYIYNLLISGCAKEGYTRKAFKLFSQMRKHGLQVKASTYTSLFNACANAPTPQDGLNKAIYLRELMIEKAYEPNVLNYNAMIKAFGRCGDVKTCFTLADEMIDKKLDMTLETFNFLLQACASDKDSGFRHCLLTWHKILERGLKPDYYTFLSVLRCVRDCGFGDLKTMQQVLEKILKTETNVLLTSNENDSVLKIASGEEASPTKELNGSSGNSTQENISAESRTSENPFQKDPKPLNNTSKNPFGDPATEKAYFKENITSSSVSTKSNLQVNTEATELLMPNLLLPKPHLGSLVELSEVKAPHERLLLLGGLNGFLAVMKDCNVTPDIETCTLLLEVVPPTNAAEKQIIAWIRKIGLKADIDFFNILIKKRSMRFDYEGAKEVLSMIRTAGLKPDIVTYGVLALGCQTQEAARELLEQMSNNDIRMNIQILGAMLKQGCMQKNFSYINEIIQISLDERIKPNDFFLKHLNKFYIQCARAIDARYPTTKSKAFKQGHAKFCDKLRLYYEEQGIAGLKLEDQIKKIQERPYAKYTEPEIEGVEPLKNEKAAKKTKLRKYIKKIKLANLKDDPVEVNSADFENVKQINK